MSKDNNKVKLDDGCWVYCKEYTNRWGQLMKASDYGYQFWKFRINKKGK